MHLAANNVQEERIINDLEKSAGEEQKAVEDYEDRGKYALDAGDKETAKLYEHIAGEEKTHKREFDTRRQQLSKPGSKIANLPQTEKVWVKINDPGESTFTQGSLISWSEFKKEDSRVRNLGGKPPSVEIVKKSQFGVKSGGSYYPDNIKEKVSLYHGYRVKEVEYLDGELKGIKDWWVTTPSSQLLGFYTSEKQATDAVDEDLKHPKSLSDEKFVPALQPFEPYNFAEYVLRFNRFAEAEIPIYSGLTGINPLRVSDKVWREVIEGTDGEFIKQGDLYVFHIPEKERPAYMRAAPSWKSPEETQVNPSSTFVPAAKGTCYQDAWRFVVREQAGDLIHGTVKSGDKRIGHAWVETETGYIYEPETQNLYTKEAFKKAASPIEEYRYNHIEACVMVAGANNFGPWNDREREKLLEREPAAVIPIKNRPAVRPIQEKEIISDCAELIPFTINDIGYRDKLDDAFLSAITRVKGK